MIVLTLVFASVFFFLVSSLAGFVLTQKRVQVAKQNREQALQIAEAGLDYYKWFLAHYPNDFTDGTGAPGPYVHDYYDPEGDAIGTFSLEVSGNSSCGELASADIRSTGWTDEAPEFTRTVFGRYARPSVAEYAYILNSNVWIGDDHEIVGPYHNNGGIRMDGLNYSVMSSAQSTWLCTNGFGCSPTRSVGGVYGDGPNDELWQYPVPNIDFGGLTVDLVEMKARAQSDGIYLAQHSGASPRKGYHLIFRSNGTVDVYKVNSSERVWSTDVNGDEFQRYEVIDDEDFMGNYPIPNECGLIFIEDQVWIEGVVRGKVTVATADLNHPVYTTDMILSGSITYTTNDGTDGFTAIAQQGVRIPLLSPDVMELNGIFIAQNGSFSRNYYTTSGNHDVPQSYNSYVLRDTLTINGTIVSNGRVGTKWICGGSSYCSGYENRVTTYDRALATNPPPMTPYVSDDYRFIEWREEDE